MADRIKGITIKIGGDTTQLSKSLEGVNKTLKTTQKDLRDVNKLLKLDPKNTELLRQKQQLLQEAVQGTEQKLSKLKEAAAQMEREGVTDKNRKQYEALQREIAATEVQLKKLNEEQKSLSKADLSQLGQKFEDIGKKISSVGDNMTKKLTVPLVALGAGAIAAFNDVDKGYDTIIQKTGATGAQLEAMQASARDIATTIPVSFEEAGAAIGEVNTRFGVTGGELDELSSKFLKFAKLNGTDVSTSIDTTQKALAAFGLSAADAGPMLDTLNAVGQRTGIDMGTLTNLLVRNGAQLQEMGLDAFQAAEFLGNVEVSGVDVTQAMMGMQKAMKYAASQGKPLNEVLQDFDETMRSNAADTEKLQKAYDIFGARSGAAIYNAAKTGSLSFKELGKSMADNLGNLDATYDATLDGTDSMKTAFNALKEAGSEVGGALGEVLAPMLKSAAEALRRFAKWYRQLSPQTKEMITKLGLLAAAAGPVLSIVGRISSGIGGIIKKNPGLITGVKKLATILVTNPYAAIAVGAAAAAAGIAALVLMQNKITREYEKAKKARQDEIKASGAQADVAERYAQQLDELSKKENKSAEDKKLIKQYVDQLNSSVEGLNLTYDEENDKLSQSADQIRNKIAAMRDEAVAQAYQAKATQVATDLIETQMQLEDVRRQKKQAQAELDKAIADQNIDQQDSMMAKLRELGITEDQLTQKQKGLNDELTNYTQGAAGNLGTLGSEFKKLEQAAAEAGDTIPQEIKDGIDSGAVEVPTSLAQLQALMNPQYYNMAALAKANGLKIPAEISTGIDNGTLTAEAAAQRLAASITEDLNVDTSYIGKMLAAGMAGGMSAWESINVVQKSARALVKAAKGAAEDEGRIQSPSRLFRDQIGKNIGLGVAVGMEETLPEIEKQARRLITGAENAMLATPPQMTVAGMSGLAAGVNRLGASPTTTDNSVKQTINIYQPVSTPAETARAIRQQQIVQGLAG